MRTTRCSSLTKILPSPTLPVLAVFTIASMTGSTRSLRTAISTRALGTKSTTYSAPRYSSVCPRCRPNPLTSVTVIPETPISDNAARTSSSLKGLIIAVTSFMRDLPPPFLLGRPPPRPDRVHLSCHDRAFQLRLAGACHRQRHDTLAPIQSKSRRRRSFITRLQSSQHHQQILGVHRHSRL